MAIAEEQVHNPNLRDVRVALRMERDLTIQTRGMITKHLRLSVSPRRVYQALLDADQHAAFTGAAAAITPTMGGDFSALDGYLTGLLSELLEDRQITIACRPNEAAWPKHHLSTATFMFKPDGDGCRLTFYQQEVPADLHDRMTEVWETHYWSRLPVVPA